MLKNLIETLNSKNLFISNEFQRLYFKQIVYVFFDEDESLAEKKILELKKQSITDKDFLIKISKKFKIPHLDIINKELLNVKNISDNILMSEKLLVYFKSIENTITEREAKIFLRYSEFIEKFKEDFRYIYLSQLDISSKDFNENIINKWIYTSKSKISDEFEVDKRTLNKWLEIVGLSEKFKGKRKIYLKDYMEIYSTLFLSKSENFNISKNLILYQKRLIEGMSFNKSKLASLACSDSKTLKDNLKKNKFYSFLDVFPYSIAKNLVEQMGDEINF
jgi:hypothetical protein